MLLSYQVNALKIFYQERYTFQFEENVDGLVQFRFCGIMDCGTSNYGGEKYICVDEKESHLTITRGHRRTRYYENHCETWESVVANTGKDWGYQVDHPVKSRLKITCTQGNCELLTLALNDPHLSDSGTHVLGSYETGRDPLAYFKIRVFPASSVPAAADSQPVSDVVGAKTSTYRTVVDVFEIETGFSQKNTG